MGNPTLNFSSRVFFHLDFGLLSVASRHAIPQYQRPAAISILAIGRLFSYF
jgi:hypothetical protein